MRPGLLVSIVALLTYSSLGAAIAQAAYAVAVRAATELLTSGTYDCVADGIAYDTMNDAVTAAPGLPARSGDWLMGRGSAPRPHEYGAKCLLSGQEAGIRTSSRVSFTTESWSS